MRVVIQRVSEASVTVDGVSTGKIEQGLLVLVGFEDADTEEDISWMSSKIINLRIFSDDNGVMNVSVLDTGGAKYNFGVNIYLHRPKDTGNNNLYLCG